MSTASANYNVFLSHAIGDRKTASIVEYALSSRAIPVVQSFSEHQGKEWSDQLRRDLIESSALVVILTSATLKSPNIAFEVGAATAWGKPVYLLLDGVAKSELPIFLRRFPTYPVTKLNLLVEELAKAPEPFSEDDRHALIEAYRDLGVSADQVVVRPGVLDNLTASFRDKSGKQVAGERLAQELLNLRKQRKLPPTNRD
ncbi:MAG: toll/interleukin-1 receptor domain-containing protein [Pirellulales bacterium]